MRFWIAGLAAATLGGPGLLAAPQGGVSRGGESPTLYFFFSPAASGGEEGARKAKEFIKASGDKVRLRPVILISDFKSVGKLDERSPLYRTLKELQSLGQLDIPLYDEDGLRLAELWEIRSVPSFVLVNRGQAHRALGPRANLSALLECKP